MNTRPVSYTHLDVLQRGKDFAATVDIVSAYHCAHIGQRPVGNLASIGERGQICFGIRIVEMCIRDSAWVDPLRGETFILGSGDQNRLAAGICAHQITRTGRMTFADAAGDEAGISPVPAAGGQKFCKLLDGCPHRFVLQILL